MGMYDCVNGRLILFVFFQNLSLEERISKREDIQTKAVAGLIERLLPDHTDLFHLEMMKNLNQSESEANRSKH